MTINTGWTPEVTLEQQAHNIIARLNAARPDEHENKRDVGRLLAREGGITPEFVRKLDGFVREIELTGVYFGSKEWFDAIPEIEF